VARHGVTTESVRRRDYVDLRRALEVLRVRGEHDLADVLITASLNRAGAETQAVLA
jgi:hypothetical protein